MPIPPVHGVHKRALLRDDVYQSLRNAIVNGTFAPGERLKDTELEQWLGVSRTPIREALLRLERAGLAIALPGRATIVAPLDATSIISSQQVVASIHELAARLAVPSVTPGDLAAMRRANTRFEAALKNMNVEEALLADDDFHGVFVAASGNTVIPEVLEQMTPVLRRVERVHFASLSARTSVAQHAEIVRYAGEGDADNAARVSRENWLALGYSLPE